MLLNLFQSRDFDRQIKRRHHNDREFLRSVSMYHHHHEDNDNNVNTRNTQFSRLLSEDLDMRRNANELFANKSINREDLIRTMERFRIDSDDADDEDDDYKTPMADPPKPDFS